MAKYHKRKVRTYFFVIWVNQSIFLFLPCTHLQELSLYKDIVLACWEHFCGKRRGSAAASKKWLCSTPQWNKALYRLTVPVLVSLAPIDKDLHRAHLNSFFPGHSPWLCPANNAAYFWPGAYIALPFLFNTQSTDGVSGGDIVSTSVICRPWEHLH